MILDEAQIEYISQTLSGYGIVDDDLREDLLDHICTHIESGTFTSFESALADAIAQFGNHECIGRIQRQTWFVLNHRANIKRKRRAYRIVYIAALLLITGIIFKLMHWPFATLLLLCGLSALSLVFLPVLFYNRYKLSQQKNLTL